MKRFMIVLVCLLVLFALNAYADTVSTPTVNQKGTVVTFTFTNAGDVNFTWSDSSTTKDLMRNLRIKQVKFIPSATDDRFIIYDRGSDGSAEGPAFYDTGKLADAYDRHGDDFGGKPLQVSDPHIDISDCTLSTEANCKLIIILDK